MTFETSVQGDDWRAKACQGMPGLQKQCRISNTPPDESKHRTAIPYLQHAFWREQTPACSSVSPPRPLERANTGLQTPTCTSGQYLESIYQRLPGLFKLESVILRTRRARRYASAAGPGQSSRRAAPRPCPPPTEHHHLRRKLRVKSR